MNMVKMVRFIVILVMVVELLLVCRFVGCWKIEKYGSSVVERRGLKGGGESTLYLLPVLKE
jgi:hypothetical protein